MDRVVPVVLVAAVDEEASGVVAMSAACDLPGAYVLGYRIEIDADRVVRTGGDMTGSTSQELRIGHLCTGCLVREDVLPELVRLARTGPSAIVLRLPAAMEPAHLLWSIDHERVDGVRVSDVIRPASVVAAVGGEDPLADLLGEELLLEHGVATSAGEDRGTGEALARIVETADTVVLTGEAPDRACCDRVFGALLRPGGVVVHGAAGWDVQEAVGTRFDGAATAAWLDPTHPSKPQELERDEAWVLRLESWRPFHPGRLLAALEDLACGWFRVRGCCWLPSRPGTVVQWDGAGGQLSIGVAGEWGGDDPITRLVVTGVAAQDARPTLRAAFERALLTDPEVRRGPAPWACGTDGLEPWLGPVTADDAA